MSAPHGMPSWRLCLSLRIIRPVHHYHPSTGIGWWMWESPGEDTDQYAQIDGDAIDKLGGGAVGEMLMPLIEKLKKSL